MKGGVLTLKGSSMAPHLNEGCLVKVEPVEAGDLKIGDAIVFYKDSKDVLMCHRIVGKLERNGKIHYLEKGDNANRIGLISKDDIIGRVKYMIDNGKTRPLEQYVIVNRFFLRLVTMLIGFYNRSAHAIKNILFSGRENRLTFFLGRVMGRFYCLLLNMALKRKD